MTYSVYSLNDETFNHFTLAEVLAELEEEVGLEEGQVIYMGKSERRKASFYFDQTTMESLLDGLEENAFDHVGEVSGGFTDCLRSEWSREDGSKLSALGKDLRQLIAYWLDVNVPVNFYLVEEVQPIIVTAEMIEEYRHGAEV